MNITDMSIYIGNYRCSDFIYNIDIILKELQESHISFDYFMYCIYFSFDIVVIYSLSENTHSDLIKYLIDATVICNTDEQDYLVQQNKKLLQQEFGESR